MVKTGWHLCYCSKTKLHVLCCEWRCWVGMTLVRQQNTKACFKVYIMFYCWSFTPWYQCPETTGWQIVTFGEFFHSQFCIFGMACMTIFEFVKRKTYFYLCEQSISECWQCKHISDYFSSLLYPVPIMILPQIHDWGPNWSKIPCIFKRTYQMKTISLPHFFGQRHQIWLNYPICQWLKAQYQLFY